MVILLRTILFRSSNTNPHQGMLFKVLNECKNKMALFAQSVVRIQKIGVSLDQKPHRLLIFCIFRIGYCVLGIAYWVLRIGYCVLRITYWVLRIGYWVLRIAYCVVPELVEGLRIASCVLRIRH